MKGNRTALIIVFAALIILIGFLLVRFGEHNKVNWYSMFHESESQPYDLSVISKLLDDYFPDKNYTVINKPLNTILPVSPPKKSSYVFIGATIFLRDTDYTHLCSFVSNGNDALIVASEIPDDLVSKIRGMESYYGDKFFNAYQSTVTLNFTHPSLRKTGGYWYDYIYNWEKEEYRWTYFSDSLLFSSVDIVRLGNLNDLYVNFIRVPYGKGSFYFHTDPIAFTNYYLKNAEGLDYAQKVFSNLSSSDIYWDEFSKVPQFSGGGNLGNTETPLRYILSQTSLKWAWYVMLGMILLFLLFRAKRDQRIIPVVEQNVNTSLEFIHTIGRLYFMQNDHRALALQKMKLFLSFIRMRYNLQTKVLDKVFIQRLSEKSQIDHNSIEAILSDYKTIENMIDISVEQLTAFHNMLEAFYQKCK